MSTLTMDTILSIENLATPRHGVVTTAELAREGVSKAAVGYRVRRGYWQRVLRGLYVLHSGPLSREAELWAALMAGGEGAALSHDTAAEVWNIDGGANCPGRGPGTPVHIVVPYGRSGKGRVSSAAEHTAESIRPLHIPSGSRHPGVCVHRSRTLLYSSVDGLPPRVSAADTLIDLCAAEPTPVAAYSRMVRLAANSRFPATETVYSRALRRRPWRHRQAIVEALEAVCSGIDSRLEAEYFLRVEREYGLPTPERQVPVIVDGRRLYEDLVYDGPEGRLIVRLDGAASHTLRAVRFRDRRRDNSAQLLGAYRLVYGWQDVTETPQEVAREVAVMLQRIGLQAVVPAEGGFSAA